MGVKVTNNAYGTLSAGIASGDTTITLDGGQGARFPTLGAGDYFYVTLVDTANNIEVVKVTARSTDSMTVVRGQDNTTAKAYAIGDRCELRPTAALFNDLQTSIDSITTDVVADTTPQLGGNLDLNSNNITGTGNVNITGSITASSTVKGALKGITKFTSSGTYTVPADVGVVKVYVTGGGGGGGAHNGDDAQGGGGAGGTAIKVIDLSSVSSVYCTIGGGGSAASGNTATGAGTGGTSSFGAYCSASGGAGVPTWGGGGRGGVGSGGDLNLYGSDGQTGNIDGQGNEEAGGNGGESFWGGTGSGGTYWYNRQAPRGWGCGGSGTHVVSNNSGSDGYSGVVVIEEYYK